MSSSHRRARRLTAGVLAAGLVLGVAPAARGDAAAPDVQVTFLLKALAYDRNAAKRGADGLRIAVIHSDAADAAQQLAREFAGRDAVVSAEVVAFTSSSDLLSRVGGDGFNAIYVHESAARVLMAVLQVARARSVPSMGEATVVERGASLGVWLADGTPKIIVNLRAAKSERLDLDARLLRFAVVIR